MISTLWGRLWTLHDEVKDVFRLFVNPNKSNIVKKQNDNDNTFSDSGDDYGGGDHRSNKARTIGLILGPLLFFIMLFFFKPEGLSAEGTAIAASTVWIAVWWITEAVPIPVTSLLPLVLFPLTEGLAAGDTASAYGNETIFLFMGGFMIR